MYIRRPRIALLMALVLSTIAVIVWVHNKSLDYTTSGGGIVETVPVGPTETTESSRNPILSMVADDQRYSPRVQDDQFGDFRIGKTWYSLRTDGSLLSYDPEHGLVNNTKRL